MSFRSHLSVLTGARDFAMLRRSAYYALAALTVFACDQRPPQQPVSPADRVVVPPPATTELQLTHDGALSAQARVALRVRVSPPEAAKAIDASAIHIVVVSRDLAWFAHLHPVADDTGFSAPILFPRDGEYIAFASMSSRTPTASSRSVLTVGKGRPRARVKREPEMPSSKSLAGQHEVELTATPPRPTPGGWTTLTFRITSHGIPASVFTPLAAHHLAIISREGERLTHAHSAIGEAKGGVRGALHLKVDSLHRDESAHTPLVDGRISYHVQFDRAGRYALWFEGIPNVKPIPFAIEVAPPPPADDFGH